MVPVTAETIRSVYVLLQTFPPFSRWHLPKAEKLNFVVAPLISMWGDYDPVSKTLRISSAKVSTFQNLVLAVAHETIHVKQDMGKWPVKNPHNADFKRMAKQVCEAFSFDFANF